MAFAYPLAFLLLPPLLVGVLLLEVRLPASPRRRLARVAVRGVLVALVVAALADPRGTTRLTLDRRLVVAVDRSDAMDVHARLEALELAQGAARAAAEAGAAVTLVGFGDRAAPPHRLTGSWPRGPGGAWPEAPLGIAPGPVPEPARTAEGRPAAALAAAALAFGPDERGTVLLLTTGRGALEGLEEAARQLEASGLRLRAAALPRHAPPLPPRPVLEALDLPPTTRGPFDVRARVGGEGAIDVELLVDGTSQGVRRADGGQGAATSVVAFEDVDAGPGLHEVAIVLRGEDDQVPPRLERRLVVVEPPPFVLVLVEDPETSATRRALSAQGYVVQALPPDALPAALLSEGPPPDALVLDAAAAARLAPEAQAALVERVERGLGLFVEAGTSEEAWTALAEGALGRILPVTPLAPPPVPPSPPTPRPEPEPDTPPPAPEPPEPDEGPGLAAERRPEEALPISLMLVLDRSGSMEGAKLAMAVEGARRAAAALSPFDRVGVITFAEDSTLDIPPTDVARLGNLGMRLAMLRADGNTDIYGALVRATSVLEREKAPIRHLILLTDGDQNATEALFSPLVRRMADAEITLTALGLGYSHNEVLLKRLVQFAARGRYVPVDGEAQLPRILTRDTERVAEYRAREAQALARLQDPDRRPEPGEPPAPPPPIPPDPGPEPTPPTPPPEGPALQPLHLLRPHEATRGVDPDALPAVGAPRRASPRPAAPLLLARGDGEAVLAARRWGLGRILLWALPADAEGVQAWPDLGRVLVQGVRSVRAPRGAFAKAPSGRILRTPDGERLVLDPPADAGAPAVRVTWTDADGTRELGAFLPGREVALPAAPAGTAAVVRLVPADGSAAGAPLTYLANAPRPDGPRLGDADALAARLGPAASGAEGPLLAAPATRTVPRPLWPFLLALALLLLPLDAWLHRRTAGAS